MSGLGHSTRVLLGSGGISTEERKATYRELVTEHFSGCPSIVFVPLAFAVDAATGALKRRYACPGAGSALRARLGLPAGEWDAHPISGGTNAVRINTTHFLL